MHRITRITLALCLASTIALGAITGTQAMAASKTVTITVKGTQNGLKLAGAVTAGTYGKGSYTGTVTGGGTGSVLALKLSGGTLKITTAASIAGRSLKGTWKTSGGTGKYAKVKASGALGGDLQTGVIKFTGKSK